MGWREIRKSDPSLAQLMLFKESLDEILERYQIPRDSLHRWQREGWLSIPAEAKETNMAYVNELRFLASLDSGLLSTTQIDRLLAELPRPLVFDPDSIAYCFARNAWVTDVDDWDPHEASDRLFKELSEEPDLELIRDLRDGLIRILDNLLDEAQEEK